MDGQNVKGAKSFFVQNVLVSKHRGGKTSVLWKQNVLRAKQVVTLT